MIPAGVEIYVCTSPIDMRWSFDRLSGVVRERFGREPMGGALFVFFGKRRETVKVMFADSSGICMFYKRLSQGLFAPIEAMEPNCTYVELDEAAFEDLLDGVVSETRKPTRRPRRRIH
jgi:transposase